MDRYGQLAGGTLALSLMAMSAGAQTISSIGSLTNVAPSGVYGLNRDGTVAAGYSIPSGSMRAVRWTPAGLQNLGLVPGGLRSQAFAVSDDGSVVVGASILSHAGHVFRWTATDGMVDLGTLPGQNISFAYAVSRDGIVIAGGPSSGAAGHAFLWMPGSGLADLGVLPGQSTSALYALNRDGSAAAGVSGTRAVRWTPELGFEDLGVLPGGTSAEADAISADGSVIAGFSGSSSGDRAFRWTPSGGMEDLGLAPGHFASFGWAISADGSVIAGSDGSTAMIWTPATGMAPLRDFLIARGVNAGAWTLQSCYAISSDGTAMAGTGILGAYSRGWVVQGLTSVCAPVITEAPAPAQACSTGQASFNVTASGAGVSYRWEIETSPGVWTPIGHDPLPLPCGGSAVMLDALAGHATIGVQPCPGVNIYPIRAVASNACGDAPSDPAAYTVCAADFNCDGTTNSQDFFDFLNAFFNGSADFNADGVTNSQDFFDYLNVFFSGC
jgi:probable HAF family extracellular repeat protein